MQDTNPSTKWVEGTNTFRLIQYQDIPIDRHNDVTYTQVVCEVRPQKEAQTEQESQVAATGYVTQVTQEQKQG